MVDNGVTPVPHADFILQAQDIEEILVSGSGRPADENTAPTGDTETLELRLINNGG